MKFIRFWEDNCYFKRIKELRSKMEFLLCLKVNCVWFGEKDFMIIESS